MANYLLQFDFEILYRPGLSNTEADCLSRNPVLDSEFGNNVPDILPTVNLLEISEIKKGQNKLLKNKYDTIKNGIILRKLRGKQRILLNEEHDNRLIKKIHLMYGHIGSKHISYTIKKYFYFPHMYKLISDYCMKYEVFIKNKSRKEKERGLMGYLGLATTPFEIMSLDTIGGFGEDCPQNDIFTYWWIILFATPTSTLRQTKLQARLLT